MVRRHRPSRQRQRHLWVTPTIQGAVCLRGRACSQVWGQLSLTSPSLPSRRYPAGIALARSWQSSNMQLYCRSWQSGCRDFACSRGRPTSSRAPCLSVFQQRCNWSGTMQPDHLLTVAFEAAEGNTLGLVGGKGASLARMVAAVLESRHFRGSRQVFDALGPPWRCNVAGGGRHGCFGHC